jgi:hypothetical protein
MSETFWKPYQKGTAMVTLLPGSGKTASGLIVKEHEDRTKLLAYVLRTNDCKEIREGDFIVFEYGVQEDVRDATGETFSVLAENHVTDVLGSDPSL